MKRMIIPAVAAIFAAVTGAGPASSGPATAVLGGGSGIYLSHGALCSLTTIGFDGAGRLVGITAAHCADEDEPLNTEVAAERGAGAGYVGKIVNEYAPLDWAVILLDPAKVIPVRTIGGTTINGVGHFPGPGGVVCDDGRTTGRDCSIVWGREGKFMMNQTCSRPGDSGGPITDGDRVVGMTNAGRYKIGPIKLPECYNAGNPVHDITLSTTMDEVLASINGSGGVGAGFHTF